MAALNLSRLRTFLVVAETLNFREAATRLSVAQPAVSKSIQMLEEEIGFRLLERTTRRVNLTPAGVALAKEAGELLAQLERSVRNAGQIAAGQAGEIIVGYSAQATNGPTAKIVVAFRSAFPNATIGIYSLSSDELMRALEAGRIDVGFLLSAACKQPLRHVVVERERFVVLMSAYHPLAKRKSVRLSELAHIPFILGTANRWQTFRSLIDNVCLQAGFLPTVAEEADDVPLLLQLISMEKGVTLYGSAIVPSLTPEIVAVTVRDAHAGFDLSVAWHGNRNVPLVQKFVAMAQHFEKNHKAGRRSIASASGVRRAPIGS